jgi:hypothetical protein
MGSYVFHSNLDKTVKTMGRGDALGIEVFQNEYSSSHYYEIGETYETYANKGWWWGLWWWWWW